MMNAVAGIMVTGIMPTGLRMALAFLLTALCATGAVAGGAGTAGDPFTALSDAYTAPSGRYSFDTGSGPFLADVDSSEGGGWVLVLQYGHRAGTNPPLAVLGAGTDLPVLSTAPLATDESGDPARWGHAGNAAMSRFPGDIELRWQGQTSAPHGRSIHFRSTDGDAYVRTGTGNFRHIDTTFIALTGHTAIIPGQAPGNFSNRGDYALTAFPFYNPGTHHWGIRGVTSVSTADSDGSRWEVDDASSDHDTIHRVWVRSAAPLQVTQTGDDGEGSLRQAMTVANADPARDAITFAIPGAGPHTIALSSALPALTDDGTGIDGITQSGAACGQLTTGTPHDLRIAIEGGGTGGATLDLRGASQSLRGLSIVGAEGHGVRTTSLTTGAVLDCLHVGVLPDGTTGNATARSDGAYNAIRLFDSTDPILRNSLIAGNADDTGDSGISINGGSGARLTGNIIGLDESGMAPLGNGQYGIIINGDNSGIVIGGTTAATRNVISGNALDGIRIDEARDIAVLGNYLGLGRDGAAPLGNGRTGLSIGNTTTIRIGDGTAGGRNVLSDNLRGIIILQTTGATIEGNHVGTDASGLSARPNFDDGINISTGTVDVQIIGNVISANGKPANTSTAIGIVLVNGASATLLGNRIGVGADGTTPLGNDSDGIYANGPSTAMIGDGTVQGANIIAHNGGAGGITSIDSTRIAILGNAIHSNTGPGIDLGRNGVTANDGGDGDAGPNDLLNYPVIDQFVADGSTAVSYTIGLDVPAHGDGYRVEFFTTAAPDATNGEGAVYLGGVDVAGPGTHSGSFTARAAVAVGDSISATTTRRTATGFDITSEFSVNATSFTANPAQLAATKSVAVIEDGLVDGDDTVAIPGATLRYTITIRNDGTGPADADTTVIADQIPANGSLKVDDFGGVTGTGPLGVRQGVPDSGLSYSFLGLASTADDLEFSDDGGASWGYAPIDSGDGTDPRVTHVRIRPDGAFRANGGTPPSIDLEYEVVLF